MDIVKTTHFALRVHWAGLLLVGLAVATGHGMAALCAVAALLIHEGFHFLAVCLLKAPLKKVELTPFGGVMDVESFQNLPVAHRVCIAAAGPVGSMLVYMLCHRLLAGPFWMELGRFSLWLGFWNALPLLPMDGGQVAAALCETLPFAQQLKKGLMWMGIGLGLLLVGLAVYGAWLGHVNLTLMMVGPYLCYAARQAYVTERMRLVEQRLTLRAKLRRAGSMPVDGTAYMSTLPRHERLKLLLRLPGGKLHYFFVLNPGSGQVERVMEEGEMIREILKESQAGER